MHKRNGFTIVELIIVILVIGILVTLGVIAWRESRRNAIMADQRTNILRLKDALKKYYEKNGEYPSYTSSPTMARCGHWGNANVQTTECYNGELGSVLVPEFIDSMPKAPSGKDFRYVVEVPSDPQTGIYRYAFMFVKENNYPTCKSGKDMVASWWISVPGCEF